MIVEGQLVACSILHIYNNLLSGLLYFLCSLGALEILDDLSTTEKALEEH